MSKENAKRTRGFLMIVMLIISVLIGSSGCTSYPETKGMTPVEKAEYIEDKRILKREEFHNFVLGCHDAKLVLLYQGMKTAAGTAHVRRDGTVYLPRNHRKYQYQCGRGRDVIRSLEQAGWL